MMELILKVKSRCTSGDSFIPSYGCKISDCCGAFEVGEEYQAVVSERIYKLGDHLTQLTNITVYNGSKDGYGDPDGRSYSDLTEFNAEWETVSARY